MVDEITDRTWMVVDAVDGRVHYYVDLGRIEPADVPHRGMLVALAGDQTLRGSPRPSRGWRSVRGGGRPSRDVRRADLAR
jgi:hypothetical protein